MCEDEKKIPDWVLWLMAAALLIAMLLGVVSTAGANPSSMPVFLGRATPVAFRSKTTSATGALSVPAGAAVGDIAIIVLSESNVGAVAVTSGSGGMWSSTFVGVGGTSCGGSPCSSGVLWRKLTAGDLVGTWTVTSGLDPNPPCTALDYNSNGATTFTKKEEEGNFGAVSSVAFTGYTPTFTTRGAFSVFFSRPAAATIPTGFTSRDATVGSGAFNVPNSADLLNYQSGGFTWSGLGGNGGYGAVFEFSGP
jgi:hypothetical protein